MGNTCDPDYEVKPIQQSNRSGSRLINPKPVKNAPSPSYAYQVLQPELNQNVQITLNNKMIGESKRLSSEQKPFYYIVEKNAYYQGDFNAEKAPNGQGIAIFEDGTYYQGNFSNGEAQDEDGLIIFPNGGYYKGNVRNSTMNGKGKFIHENVYSYDGQWKDGYPSGNGLETYQQDKAQYNGKFDSGLKSGSGEYSWESKNSYYEGNFKNGLMNDDKGKIQSKGGATYTGKFINGRRQGHGVVKTANGSLEGDFINDQINGQGEFRWNDGKVYKGQFHKSQFHGNGQIEYPNKTIAQGEWIQNHNKTIKIVK